ncbi:Type III restriction modification system endonuclase subunit, Res [Mycoplasmopsis agalactiae 14628]|uniref:Type III restriction modification system endonuclase subunit, Res n=1 Tax=Mycoplasmopsis agalactiae 14628 TaxID=1110504 RepID=I5D6R7_MYCAA|nr:DEAD/DEAH box helicase family protein [Mycoplasmopsis agalactiae]EIN15376.1 Type III restriction modification system endonuclase subunit, Res [Mycoplasmopsis agalactiae 14628]
MEDIFLYQKLNSQKEVITFKKELPEVISKNLSSNILLRDYQKDAFDNFIINYEKNSKTKQIHNLFHMATGSGKTVIMAGLMLYLYTKGYKKFVFFVNQTNVLEKTIDNFTNSLSSKYLFNKDLEYNGNRIRIKKVNNFSNSIYNDDIQVVFTTTQKLHLDQIDRKENSLTFDDFEDKIVFISDESHHINSSTKNKNKQEIEENQTWETSVMNAFNSNKDSILLEFTATCDLKDKNVLAKYKDKIVFNYPLIDFRQSGYTKDFKNFASNTDLFTRALIALVISEYRKYLFADLRLNIKPVVLFKSQKIVESIAFYDEFFKKLKELNSVQIKKLEILNLDILNTAIKYFENKDGNLDLLEQSIKNSFTKDNSIIMNGTTDNTKEKQLLVNSLEDKSNPIRLLFTVDMLNEGWDVLNLFDIVRLYDTRQGGKTKVSSYTIKEAQLIGRGARYCPFVIDDEELKFKRKFDYDIENQYRILETMLYHSQNDSLYIQELRKALIETGLQDDEMIELKYELKDSFTNSNFYKKGYVFSNKRVIKSRSGVKQLESSLRYKTYFYTALNQKAKLYDLFNEENESNNESIKSQITKLKFKEIPINVLTGASDCFSELSFDKLKEKYPLLKTKKEFLTSDDYLGNSSIQITHISNNLLTKDIFYALKQALAQIANHIVSLKPEYEGTKEFYEKFLRNVVKNKTIHISKISSNSGYGVSQNKLEDPEYKLDLENANWYAFNDNFGTTEEKALLKYFSDHIIPILEEKKLEYFVIRNERFADLALYTFDHGERFEPDFLLFLRKKQSLLVDDSKTTYQAYVEPKGEFLKDVDSWKEKFLKQIKEGSKIEKSQIRGEYKLIGFPFFSKMAEDKEQFENQINLILKEL